MKYKYITFISIAIFGIALTFYFIITMSFGKYGRAEVTKIYYADNISFAQEKIIEKFNKKYWGKIEVVPINLPFTKFTTNERKELLARSLRSKTQKIDIFAVDLIWVKRFEKWSEPLSNFPIGIDTSKFLPIAFKSCFVNNKLIAVPLYIDIGLMYYRKDLIEQIDQSGKIKQKLQNSISWSEFIDLGSRFNKNKNPFYIYPSDKYEGFMCTLTELFLSQNPEIFSKDKIDLTSESARKSLKLLYDLINKKHLSPKDVLSFRERQSYNYFIKNNAVFVRGWMSYDKDSENIHSTSLFKQKIAKAAMPHFKGRKPITALGGWNLMISKWSEHKKESLIFIKYLLSDESQRLLYETSALLPSRKSFYYSDESRKEFPELKYSKKLLDNAILRPSRVDYTRISDIITYYFNEALSNNITIDEALKTATEDINSGRTLIK